MKAMYDFLMVGGLLAVTPGPNMVYVMARSVSQGTKAGLVSLAGVMLGYFTYMLGAAFGISALFLAIPGAARALALFGAGYLLYMAWRILGPGGRSPLQVERTDAQPPRNLLAMGAMTSLLNPKLALVFLSVLPQFIDYQAGDILRQSLILGLALTAAFASVNACVAIASGRAAAAMTSRPGMLAAQRWIVGALLVLLAVKLGLQAL
ncbi:LysE family translocator [Cupriavidus sp. BIS7]|uniref:LysE family translocator n=1 Tax=Cupriavidus sp. BIS7 TaxID=1217718 RepID=UPI0004745ED5|nr:LysE family translocator [Cupriavidus sp. BIS7]